MGEPWGKPYYRIRDYVRLCARSSTREEPVTLDGREISLPTRAKVPLGVGKPLKSRSCT